MINIARINSSNFFPWAGKYFFLGRAQKFLHAVTIVTIGQLFFCTNYNVS